MEKEDNTKSLPEKTSEEIIKLIVEKDYKVGDQMPNEYDLALQLGVGRSTVREAIRILISRNILEIRRGAGTFISQKKGVSDDPLGLIFIKDKHKLTMDLLEVRSFIEPNIAALAAIHATEEEINDIDKICGEIEELILKKESHRVKDIELHTAIARSSGNIVVHNLIPIINQAIPLFIDITDNKLLEETIITHKGIVEAIKNGDSHRAYNEMYLHLIYNRRVIEKTIQNFNQSNK